MLRRNGTETLPRLLLVAGDLAIAALALYLAFRARIAMALPLAAAPLPPDRLHFFFEMLPWLAVAQPVALALFGLYEAGPSRPRLELARWLAFAVALEVLALAAANFFRDRSFPRSVLLLYAGLDLTILFIWRSVTQRLRRERQRRVVLIGTGPAALEIARNLAQFRWHGLRIAGHLPQPGAPSLAPDSDASALGPRLASFDELERRLAAGEVDDVLLAPEPSGWQAQLVGRLAAARRPRTSLLLLPGPFESLIGKTRYRWVNDLPLIEVVRESEWRISHPLKRLLDLVGAAALVVVASPAFAASVLAVRLTSPGPALYRQERIGRGRRPFTLLKLRTMRRDAEKESGEVLAEPNDPRLTPVGGFLRRTRLDELPQLLNVLAGEMSLVGPRPERPGFVARFLDDVPGYAERFSVLPGVTGLAQVNGDYYSSPDNKLRYDLAYIANWSVWLDLSILLRTVRTVLSSRGV